MSSKVLDVLRAKLGDALEQTGSEHGDEVAVIKRDRLAEVAKLCRDDAALALDQPVFVTCIDRLDWQPVGPVAEGVAPAWDGESPRFEVCWQLRSIPHRHRLRLKVRVGESDPRVPSLTGLWPGFNWQERETFDMYGIRFDGHPDLRRIYLYDEFVGHPLRKDYPKDKRQPLVHRTDLVGDH